VPKDHPESNFKMAFEAFLSKVPLPPENIYRIEADNKPPKEAARRYETSLRNFFASFKESRSFPPFDLIILGVGRDGHTASLFPKSSALKEKHRWAVDVFNPSASPPLPRITLTLPVINSAKYVLFLVSIKEKKETVQMILENPERARQLYPAAMVNPQEKLTWFITTLTN
jgi:6-phosphogluconolactonase